MKKNKKKNIIITGIIIIFFIIIIIAVILFNGQKLNTNSTIVNQLYDYLGSSDLEICSGLNVYGEELVTYDDINNATRLCNAYVLLEESKMEEVILEKDEDDEEICTLDDFTYATDNYEEDECTLIKISEENLNSAYKKLYGKEIEENEEFLINYNTICNFKNDTYYCGLLETFTKTFGSEPHTFRAIKKAYKKGDEIIIYDYFIRIANYECYNSYTGKTTNNNCTNSLPENDNYDFVDYDFVKKYGTEYKHIFKKQNNYYYWVSSEPI